MANISNAMESGVMKLVFQAIDWSLYADDTVTTPQANIDVSLSTGTLTDTSTMSTTESTYASYARVVVARSAAGWDEAAGVITPAAVIDFPAGTSGAGGGAVTHFATGVTGGGAVAVLMWGTVTPNITVGEGVTPRLTMATTLTLD